MRPVRPATLALVPEALELHRMNTTRRTILALPGALLVDHACRARDAPSVWAEWATAPFDIKGPGEAGGLFIYLHEEGREDSPVALIFAEMARVAQWDVMRINRQLHVDYQENDAAILEFVSDRVDHMRRQGYDQIIVGGISRGGWLALSASSIAGVDAVIGLAPRTKTLDAGEHKSGLDVLAPRLADGRATRIAAIFVDENPEVARRVLQQNGARFMLVDRLADLQGRAAANSGRFVRRYRDCLVQFAQSGDGRAGEVQCFSAGGYAVGLEIGFPASDPASREFPRNTDPAFRAFWGRWEGDDEDGAYMIMETVGIDWEGIVLRMGASIAPGGRYQAAGLMGDRVFELDGSRTRLYYKVREGPELVAVQLKSASELEYRNQGTIDGRFRTQRMRLFKRTA
jgi:hypothetical protein